MGTSGVTKIRKKGVGLGLGLGLGLFLCADVIDRLNVLRGRGMASLYSWSCKR